MPRSSQIEPEERFPTSWETDFSGRARLVTYRSGYAPHTRLSAMQTHFEAQSLPLRIDARETQLPGRTMELGLEVIKELRPFQTAQGALSLLYKSSSSCSSLKVSIHAQNPL
jgi:hypothetical protein